MGETRFSTRFWVVFLLSAAIFAAPCAGRTISVDANGTGDYPTIQAAIDDSNDGDVIVLCPGTYTGPGNRDIDFRGKAITVRSTDPTDSNIVAATIIDCNGLGRGFVLRTGETCDSVIYGLSIINAQAIRGAAIWCEYSSPVIANCVIARNSVASGGGGGIWALDGSVTLANCLFDNNTSQFAGGAVYLRCGTTVITGCTFIENSAVSSGGAIYCFDANLTATDCLFTENHAEHVGGAIYSLGDGLVITERCVFTGNSNTAFAGMGSKTKVLTCRFHGNSDNGSDAAGGALTLAYEYAEVIGCAIIGNSVTGASSRGGGGIYCWDGDSTISNCIIAGNSSSTEGGGICSRWHATPKVVNCTVVGNVAAQNGGGIACREADVSIVNSIVRGNAAPRATELFAWGEPLHDWKPYVAVTHSNLRTGHSEVEAHESTLIWGDGNIDANPCFADPGYWDPNGTPEDANDDFWISGNYHLKSQGGRWDANEGRWVTDEVTSLCIDAGDPTSPIGLEPFPNGGVINMGAYGGTAEASKSYFGGPPCETIVAGDINGDCRINFEDFRIMALHWIEDHKP